jgi:hypothetical protein
VWSINPVFDPTAEFGTTVNQAQLDAATLAIANRTISTNLAALMSTTFSRTGARVEVRDDVTDALLGISVQGSSTPQAGTGTIKLPLQAAVVISIRTDTPGGRGRGRLYWPALGATLATTGRLSAPTTAQILSEFRAYLNGIDTDLTTAFPLISFDLAVRSKAAKATPHAVRLQVGDVIDTQRRRRDALAESYGQIAYPS